ncbi:uncharacterized protein A1O5_06939 [Cladophialophora psammophila CBS 110553]|uniref:Uncharacterized protein n=1 Tax=Cladophialophora psammophila CBS 110553 TaxID=1182543 RepID=W9WNX5_9EURO|nr:uncharacterized protein A1O5_06939 [Cladophialophora psammophila CBS 110553]EXJ69867.1 hypothetical protein A1O5_06939 [Cladophialophora psammophila CBS 110553]
MFRTLKAYRLQSTKLKTVAVSQYKALTLTRRWTEKEIASCVWGLPTASLVRGQNSNCFPFGSASFNGSLEAPNMTRKEWWCPQSMTYGFLGFSYPMEGECYDDSFDRINADLQRQKRDFGASLIRVYLPYCYTTYIWESLIKAAVANDMGVVAQVAWPLNGDPKIATSIIEILSNSTYKDVAPYMFHSIEFGTEPIGDQDDGDNFINDLVNFKAAVRPYGIPVGISEDWDRPGIMCSNYTAGQAPGLGPTGKQILPQSDFVHAHIMPYYHGYNISGSWNYISEQVHWYKNYTPVPLVISETQWAWELNVLHQGSKDIDTPQYTTFWKTYDENCQFFKKNNVGWFLHAWKWEGTFNMVTPNGSYAIPNWKPQKC